MKSSNFAKFLLFSILIPPRVEILAIAGSSFRLTDIFFIFLLFWCLINIRVIKNHLFSYKSILKVITYILICNFFSTCLSVGLGRLDFLTGVLYFLRPVQYLLLFPLALVLSHGESIFIQRLLKTFTMLNFLIVLLQVNFGIQIGTDRFGFSRSSSLLGGPYELGIVSVFLLIYWYEKSRVILFFMSAYMLLLSASRANAIAIIFILIYVLMSKNKRNKLKSERNLKFMAISTFIILVLAVSPFATELGILGNNFSNRFNNTQNELPILSSIDKGLSVERIQNSEDYIVAAFIGVPNLTYQSDSVDLSTSRRAYIWALVINTVNQNSGWLFGLGSGFYSSAVDGNWIRIYGEAGLFGVILWVSLFRKIFKVLNYPGRYFLIAWIVNGFFIDIFTALIPNIMFYLMLANQENNHESSLKIVN